MKFLPNYAKVSLSAQETQKEAEITKSSSNELINVSNKLIFRNSKI